MNHVWSLNSIFWIPQYSSISKFRTTSKSKTKVAETFLTLSRAVEQLCSTFLPPRPQYESPWEMGVQIANKFGSLYSPESDAFREQTKVLDKWSLSAGFPVGTQRVVCWDESNFPGTRKIHLASWDPGLQHEYASQHSPNFDGARTFSRLGTLRRSFVLL